MARTAGPKSASRTYAKRGAGDSVLSVKVTLRGPKPPIWRRLLMPANMTLADLHVAIQAAMGWDGGHLHAFDIGGEQYGDPQDVDDVANQERLTLISLLRSGINRFTYTYDFGDNWEHAVLIERIQPAIEGQHYPACVAGKRNCPPDDCGGHWGYEELLAVLADPTHPEHVDRLEWVGGAFDPEAFSVEAADAAVAGRLDRRR